jgi:lactoylglutathione lyase
LNDTQFLELLPGAETDRAPGQGANGVNHLCFAIEDLDATAAKWKADGVELTSEVKSGVDRNKGAWIEDPDGNRIELMEMAPDCIQYDAVRRFHANGS